MESHLETAIEAARIGGKILIKNLSSPKRKRVARKQQFDFVTQVDHLSERAIIEFISRRHPRHSILAEESGGQKQGDGYLWIIDPLDGTKNYIHQFPIFGVSVALMRDGELLVGAILDPIRNELFYAEKDKGAFLNKPIHVSARKDFSLYLLATGFPFRAKQLTSPFFEAFKALFLQVSDFRRAGAAALDLAYVACGRLDGFWEVTLSPWDIAAGTLLIKEAGGKVTDIWGEDRFLQTGHIVASNGQHHDKITEVTKDAFRDLI